MNYSVPERVEGQFWDPQEVLPGQVTFSILVQTKKPVKKIPTRIFLGTEATLTWCAKSQSVFGWSQFPPELTRNDSKMWAGSLHKNTDILRNPPDNFRDPPDNLFHESVRDTWGYLVFSEVIWWIPEVIWRGVCSRDVHTSKHRKNCECCPLSLLIVR